MNNVYKLHARLLKTCLHDDPAWVHRLLLQCTASAPDGLSYARCFFSYVSSPDTLAYNTIIRAHAHFSPHHSLCFFTEMHRRGLCPDHFTFPFVLKASSRLQVAVYDLHSLIFKLGFHSDVYVGNGLISYYGCFGCVDSALKVFDEMTVIDLVTWSSIISCFTNNGLWYEALELFQQMQLIGNVKPDEVTMLSVVSAVSSLGALGLGRWVDCFIRRSGLVFTVSLGSALIAMYSRCGSVDDSIRVFNEMSERNVMTWTALINGLAVHGRSQGALRAFDEMRAYQFRPDHITFRGALMACSHGGLVADGWRVFDSIKNEYGIEPTVEHYGCMVDLLGRAGLVNDAFEFVEKMPIKPNAVIWRTLLGACVNHKKLDLAEKAKERIHELDPDHDGDYVLLSNAYGGVGRWLDKAQIRAKMKEKRIDKFPGYSLLYMDEVIHEFVSGDDVSHPRMVETKALLASIIGSLTAEEGYNPCTSNVLHDIEEEEKEHSLSYHSEKLAVGFALLDIHHKKTTIRIMKNLRTCHDCHSFMKHVSSRFDVEIIVRDRNRFHHFSKGSCSCKDFW